MAPAPYPLVGIAADTGAWEGFTVYSALATYMHAITAGSGAMPVIVPAAGDEIDFTVTLSENVQANGALRLTLNTGETVTVSTSAAGNSLTGTYTVGSSLTDVADLEARLAESERANARIAALEARLMRRPNYPIETNESLHQIRTIHINFFEQIRSN